MWLGASFRSLMLLPMALKSSTSWAGLWAAGEVAMTAAGAELPPAPESDSPISFRREVMAVLSKAGCASGPCHGNRVGKGGFKLSLRGEDPDADYLTLTTGLAGRRLEFRAPEQSLLLLK